MARALDGMRIVDLTHMLAGPFATHQLHLHGAQVIKIEPPENGEPMRWTTKDGARRMAPSFMAINAGKESLALDLKQPKGRELLMALMRDADAVVENFRPGVAKKLGLDYDSVKRIKPNIVYCSISGYGQDGPLQDRPAYDHVVQAITGMACLNGQEPEPPMKVGFPVVDIATGMNAASAILAALLRRARTGEGQYIDTSMVDAAVTLMFTTVTGYLASGAEPIRAGNRGFTGSPGCDTFETKDGYIAIGANTAPQFERMCAVLGASELLADEKLLDMNSLCSAGQGFVKATDAVALRASLSACLSLRSAREWETLLIAADVPAARLRAVGEFTDEVLRDTKGSILPLFDATASERAADTLSIGHRCLFDQPQTNRVAPALGSHTLSILQGYGWSRTELEEFAQTGIVGIEKGSL